MKKTPATSNLPEAAFRLDGQLCFALYSANLAMHKVYRRLLAGMDLTYPQYLVMLVLWERDGITVSELGGQLFLDSATLTPLLKRLQVSGLVSRTRSTQDERQVLVSLTAAGKALQTKAKQVPAGALCATDCPPEQLTAIKTELETLRHNLMQHS